MSLPEFKPDYTHYRDKSTVLYGASGSGKSTVMIDILKELRGHIDQVLVVSPMDRQNHVYDSGIIPLPCIHYDITAKLLEDIWERQEALANVYVRANREDIVAELFDLCNDRRAQDTITRLKQLLEVMKKEARSTGGPDVELKIKSMEIKCKDKVSEIVRETITANSARLSNLGLSEDHLFSLKFINLNPKLVLILDDCTDLLAKLGKNQIVQKLFYQGRHVQITFLIACHTDKALPPELKKNTFVTIFTEDTSARSYFDRKTNDLDKNSRMIAGNAINVAFTPLARYQKLVYVREVKLYCKYTAKLHEPFRFGSAALWELCDRIMVDANGALAANRFIGKFGL